MKDEGPVGPSFLHCVGWSWAHMKGPLALHLAGVGRRNDGPAGPSFPCVGPEYEGLLALILADHISWGNIGSAYVSD